MALLAARDFDGAEAEAREAIEIGKNAPTIAVIAMSTRVRVCLARGDVGKAREIATDMMRRLNALHGMEEGEALVRLVHAEALAAAGRIDEVREAIAYAGTRIREQAAKISDEALRASFLQSVAENARTFELASEWGCS